MTPTAEPDFFDVKRELDKILADTNRCVDDPQEETAEMFKTTPESKLTITDTDDNVVCCRPCTIAQNEKENQTMALGQKKEPNWKDKPTVMRLFPINCEVKDSAGCLAKVVGYKLSPAGRKDAGEWFCNCQYIERGSAPGMPARTLKRATDEADEAAAVTKVADVPPAKTEGYASGPQL